MSTATEYRDLLVEFAPHPIRSDADYRRTVAQLERIMEARPEASSSRSSRHSSNAMSRVTIRRLSVIRPMC